MDNWSLILLLGAIQGGLLALFLLLHRKENHHANAILGLLMLVFSLTIALPKISRVFCQQFPHFILLAFPLDFLIGPLLYIYANILTRNHTDAKATRLLHFLPFTVAAIYLLPFYMQSGADKLLYFFSLRDNGFPTDLLILWGAKNVHLLAYLIIVFFSLKVHGQDVKQLFSSLQHSGLLWLRYLITGMAIVWVLNFIFLSGFIFKMTPHFYRSFEIVNGFMMSVFVYSIGYKGLKQPEIFSNTISAFQNKQRLQKYQHSGLTTSKADKFYSLLLSFMEKNKPYKDSELTITKLAACLNISSNHLSQVINEKAQQSFFDFINSYRILEARRALSDLSLNHLTILAVAYEAGFNSKSAFYRAFKRHMRMTPSDYIKNYSF